MGKKRIYLSPPHLSGEEMEYVRRAFESEYIAPLGPQVDLFEKEFSKAVGISHAVALSSGTAALHLALRGLGVSAGDEVIAASLTFVGGVSPAVYLGARLTFIDSERSSWNMDPDLLREECRERSRNGRLPKAVISTDIYGQCADLDRIAEICSSYDIPLISDSAEAVGATYKGRSAGAGAEAAVYSFNGNKIITTSCGGMLASENENLIRRAKFLSQQAQDPFPHYEHSEIGYNYRMSNILAALGLAQLKVMPERVEAKRRIFDYYKENLSPLSGIEFMPEASYGRSNRWLTVILVAPRDFGIDREALRLALKRENIESRPVWKPMHLQPVFKGCPVRGGEVSEELFERGLCLPSGTGMTTEDLDRVVSTIKEARHVRGITG